MKVKIYSNPLENVLGIYLIDEMDRFYLTYEADGYYERHDIKEDTEIKPFITLPGRCAFDGTLKNLAEAVSEIGIKTDSDSKIEGKLEATKYHLEDMRRLARLRK